VNHAQRTWYGQCVRAGWYGENQTSMSI